MLFQNTASQTQPSTEQTLPLCWWGATAQGWGRVEAIAFFSRSSRAWWLLQLDGLGRELWGPWPPTSMSESTEQLLARGHHVT